MNVHATVGRDSVAHIANRYDVGGSVIELRWGWGEINRTCTDRP
jgi:hypothetical protein